MSVFQVQTSGRLASVAPSAAKVTKGTKAREKQVEALLALNLDVLLPEWRLAVLGTSSDGWRGADIVAADPCGTRHLFEVKYGASVSMMVEQAIAYAQATTRMDDDAWCRFRAPGALNVQRMLMDATRLSEIGEQTVAATRSRLKEALANLPPPDRVRRDVHVHLVAPKFPEEVIKRVVEYRHRYVRVSCWTIALREGRLMDFGPASSAFRMGSKRSYEPAPYRALPVLAELAVRHGSWLGREFGYPHVQNPLGLTRHKVYVTKNGGVVVDFHSRTGLLTAMDWFSDTAPEVEQKKDALLRWLSALGVARTQHMKGRSAEVVVDGHRTRCRLSSSGQCVTVSMLNDAPIEAQADWLAAVIKAKSPNPD